jgi:agmatine deiminase
VTAHSPETPAALGYRMPAEWEPHAATWLSWPHNPDTWPGKVGIIPPIWVEIVRALLPGEDVHLLVRNEKIEAEARRMLGAAGLLRPRLHLHRVPTNDGAWMRDVGPTFVTRRVDGRRPETAAINWDYNAWGGKYAPWDDDERVASRVAEITGCPVFSPGIVLEGGSIDVNGYGTVLTTESCLLNPNRNPGRSRSELENVLRGYLGVTHVLWLGDGIVGDDTDGHVDDLARFVDQRTVVTVMTDDPDDPNHAALVENHRRLSAITDQDGEPLRVITLPMPQAVIYEGQQLPASYANFYIGNAAVLVPTFSQPTDEIALEAIRLLFPTRRVVGIDAVDLVWGLGTFHCVTQQQPRA